MAAEESVKVGTDLVAFALLQVVALCASGFEEVGALLLVTCGARLALHPFEKRLCFGWH